jgi:hypothetical protein
MSAPHTNASYEVGYGKPPRRTQFQKGRSSNPGVPLVRQRPWSGGVSPPSELKRTPARRACVTRRA